MFRHTSNRVYWASRLSAARRFGRENFLTKSSGQLSVLDPVRCFSRRTEACFSIRFVIGIVTLKPEHFAITFKRENVSRDAIEKPAVVRDHHRAAGKVLQCFF